MRRNTDNHGSHRLDALPFDNSFARLPERFYTRLDPWGLPDPHLIAVSETAAELIGLHAEELEKPEFVQAFAGNAPLPGGETLAAVYSGHQFGVWAGQLGDGRAHLLGEIQTPDGPWELQLKGGGQTPYSRMGDGRAVLRSSIREFLCSEAMAALGIPTTRALALVGSNAPVRRETIETAAVVTRMSPTFVRFGSFEHWAANNDIEALQTLTDYVIDRFYPACREDKNPPRAMLAEVSRRTAELMAEWQAVGFMHGVMNTDNMSILSVTIDYGPYGFMDHFKSGHICNHSDSAGRYRFSHQPHVAIWNLQALCHALMPVMESPTALKTAVEEPFVEAYNRAFIGKMAAKLGFEQAQASDADLVVDLYKVMQESKVDYPGFFRALAKLPKTASGAEADAPVRDMFIDRDAADGWLATWRERLAADSRSDTERQAAMNAVNPKYVLRNWVAESAIRAAQQGDYSELHTIHDCLSRPFDEQPENERYAAPPPDWAEDLEVSCSS